jgi:CheY-like chemotaxis protein
MTEAARILVVDDELVVIKSAERVLKSEGYDVEGALSGRGNTKDGAGQL